MLSINVHYNPLIDEIDMELTQQRMQLIYDKFSYPLCKQHPSQENEVAFRAANKTDFAAPVTFCCKEYERIIMNELSDFLKEHPIPDAK